MRQILLARDDHRPQALSGETVDFAFFSQASAGTAARNEDGAAIWELKSGQVLVAVADGMGGHPGGGDAAATAIEALDREVTAARARPLRGAIMDAFERANRGLLEQGRGSGTTLVVVEIDAGTVRSYHAGDSRALLVGSRGRVKLETLEHSPTGYAVASGWLDRDDSLVHDDRSYLSNCVGASDMRIDVGPSIRMAPRDTLLVASDGVLDNIRHQTVIDSIRSGSLLDAAESLRMQARSAMSGDDPDLPAHPDDATAVLVRLRRPDAAGRS